MEQPNDWADLTPEEARKLVEQKLRDGAPKAIAVLRDLAANAEDPEVRRDAREYLASRAIPLQGDTPDADGDALNHE